MNACNTRAQALAQGLKTYQGAPCKRGHDGKRYTAGGGNCVACHIESMRQQYAANPEKCRERNRQWRADNPERQRELNRQQYAANLERERERSRQKRASDPEKASEMIRQWSKNNRGACRAIVAKRRAMKIAQRCTCCTDADIQKIYDIAALCGPGAEVDHKTPLNLGGRHCAKNLQALTYEEHKEKTRRDQTLIADARRKRRRFTSPQVSACPGSRPTSAS